jgi:glycosyltransferase involved in cell wall biosynthesis
MQSQNYFTFTIVTPSYNQGKFIRETILSVITQQGDFYIQYIIMDGGSKDETISVLNEISLQLESNQNKMTIEGNLYYTPTDKKDNLIFCKGVSFVWFSEKDKGQTNAINKGWELSKGNVLAWINSDDIYLPGTFQKVFLSFLNQSVNVVYGGGLHIAEKGGLIEPYPSETFERKRLLDYCYICQPTVFIRKEVNEIIGELNEGLHFCMDYEYWIRISQKYEFTFVPDFLACTRFYDDAKTLKDRFRVHKEIVEMQSRLVGKVSEHWVDVYSMIHLSENHKWSPKVLRILFPFFILKNKLHYNHRIYWTDITKSLKLLFIIFTQPFRKIKEKSR